MEEKMSKQNDKLENQKKRNYSPPALTVYGKLTEVTGGGSVNSTETMIGSGAGMMT